VTAATSRIAEPAPPNDWARALAAELAAPYFADLCAFVATERAAGVVFPPEDKVYAAFERTPLERVKVVILGQDPYHGPGQAHGLALSVEPGTAAPPTLANMLKELSTDLGCKIPDNGCLLPWAEQGVLLLNTVLTVRAGEPNSHRGKGWERFTDAVIRTVSAKEQPVVFALWGGPARKKKALIDADRHAVLEGVHPSPLAAFAGFFGSRPFSRINERLVAFGHAPIDWQLPDLGVPSTRRVRPR